MPVTCSRRPQSPAIAAAGNGISSCQFLCFVSPLTIPARRHPSLQIQHPFSPLHMLGLVECGKIGANRTGRKAERARTVNLQCGIVAAAVKTGVVISRRSFISFVHVSLALRSGEDFLHYHLYKGTFPSATPFIPTAADSIPRSRRTLRKPTAPFDIFHFGGNALSWP